MELDLNEVSRVSAPRIFEFTIAERRVVDLVADHHRQIVFQRYAAIRPNVRVIFCQSK
jgi:hypothetical protein